MTDEDKFTAEQNPRGVRVGQTWQTPDGREFEVVALERWQVRGRTQPSARTLSERLNNRGLLHGFDRCKLVYEGDASDFAPTPKDDRS